MTEIKRGSNSTGVRSTTPSAPSTSTAATDGVKSLDEVGGGQSLEDPHASYTSGGGMSVAAVTSTAIGRGDGPGKLAGLVENEPAS